MAILFTDFILMISKREVYYSEEDSVKKLYFFLLLTLLGLTPSMKCSSNLSTYFIAFCALESIYENLEINMFYCFVSLIEVYDMADVC